MRSMKSCCRRIGKDSLRPGVTRAGLFGGQFNGNSRKIRSLSIRSDSRLVARICAFRAPPAAMRSGQRRQLIEDVFATVEDQERAPVAQQRQQARHRILRTDGQSQRGCDGARYQPGIGQRAEIDEEDLAGESRKLAMSHGDGDRRLADAAGADDGDEAMQRCKFGCDLLDGLLLRPISLASAGGLTRARRGWSSPAAVCGCRRRRRLGRRGSEGKAIAAPGNVDDVAGTCGAIAERLAQRGDVETKAAFIHVHIGPDPLDQFSLVHHHAGPFGKRNEENIERAAADVQWERRPSPAGETWEAVPERTKGYFWVLGVARPARVVALCQNRCPDFMLLL